MLRRIIYSWGASFLAVSILLTIVSPGVGAVSNTGFVLDGGEPPYDLVAIVVDQAAWGDDSVDLKSKIERYAEDVQKALTRTKTMIVPVAREAKTVLKVRDLLERLYLSGNPDDKQPTRLRGVVLVSEVPLPVVHDHNRYLVSLFPYTDFIDPMYVFSDKTMTFERRSEVTEPKAEVWHGVIRAPSGGGAGMQMLAQYFDKNHAYHSGDPAYTTFKKSLLYSDLAHESASMNKFVYPRYLNYLRNMEDLVYSRFSQSWLDGLEGDAAKELASDVALVNGLAKDVPVSDAGKSLQGELVAGKKMLASGVAGDSASGGGAGGKGPAMPKIPNLLSLASAIKQFHATYPEVFSTFFTKVSAFTSGSGRWSDDETETVPEIIAKKDLFAGEYLKIVNDALETRVSSAVEKIQTPVPLYRNVTVVGAVRNEVLGAVVEMPLGSSVFSGTADTGAGNVKSALLFANQSLFRPLQKIPNGGGAGADFFTLMPEHFAGRGAVGRSDQFINGINFDDLTHAQQCGLDGGTAQKTPVAAAFRGAVGQMVQFLRVFTFGNLNMSVPDSSANPSSLPDPRKLPSLGLHTRRLSSSETLFLTGGASDHGAVVEPDREVGAPAVGGLGSVASPFKDGDVIVSVNDLFVDDERSADDAVRAFRVGDEVTVKLYRGGGSSGGAAGSGGFGGAVGFNGAAAQSMKVTLLDANADDVAAGCYGINFEHPERCFSRAARTVVGGRGATRVVGTSGGAGSAPDRVTADAAIIRQCSSFLRVQDFQSFLTGVRDYLGKIRSGSQADKLSPPGPISRDPVKFPLNDSGTFSLQNFFNLYGVLNHTDDNGDFYDTNKNGATDQIRWRDANHNGVLDLWVPPSQILSGGAGVMGTAIASPYTVPDSVVGAGKPLSVADFKKIHPELFQGDRYTGAYTGEFIGGDFGVDDPSELSHPFVPSGGDDMARWRSFEEKFLMTDGPVTYTTPEHTATGTGTADLSITFTPKIEKQLSSAFFHHEPTAATLSEHFAAPLSMGLPIDKPRSVTFLDKKRVVEQLVYPNSFSATSYEDWIAQVQAFEMKVLAAAKENGATVGGADGALTSGFLTSAFQDAARIRSAIAWRNLTLDQKHTRALVEFLNPAIDGFAGDTSDGYESWYFAADGRPTYFSTDFSGDLPVADDDPVYLAAQAASGSVSGEILGDTSGAGGSAMGGANFSGLAGVGGLTGGKGSGGGSGAGVAEQDEAVPLLQWFDAVKKWAGDLPKSFQIGGLSLSGVIDGNSFDKTFDTSHLATTISLSAKQTTLAPGGASTEVIIEARDAGGAIANGDHLSRVRIDVNGGLSGGALISPSASDIPDGMFLSDGRAVFTLVSGSSPQTVTITASGSNGATKFTAAPLKISIAAGAGGGDAKNVVINSEGSVMVAGSTVAHPIDVQVRGADGSPINDRAISYDVAVSGPATIDGLIDSDSDAPGLQTIGLTGGISFGLLPQGGGGDGGAVSVAVTAHIDDATALTASRSFTVRSDVHLNLTSSVMSLPANGVATTVVTATMRDGNGALLPDVGGSLLLTVSDPARLAIVGSDTAGGGTRAFHNGSAIFTVRGGTMSGIAQITASLVGGGAGGAAVANLPIVLTPLPASRFMVRASGALVATGAQTSLQISALDAVGNQVLSGTIPVMVRITPKTQSYGALVAGGVTGAQVPAVLVNGKGAVTLTASDRSGVVHVVVSAAGAAGASGGISPATTEVITRGRTGVGDLANLSPHVLYASMLGGAFGNVTEQNYLGGVVLFSGTTQAVGAQLSDDASAKSRPVITFNPFGSATVHDDAVQARVLSSSAGDPLHMQFSGVGATGVLADLYIKQAGQPVIVGDDVVLGAAGGSGGAAGGRGVFVQKRSTDADVRLESKSDGVGVFKGTLEVARVNTIGGGAALSPDVSFVIADAATDDVAASGSALVDILLRGVVVARMQIKFDAVNSLKLLNNFSETQIGMLSDGVWLASQSGVASDAYRFEQQYVGFSTEGPKGYVLVTDGVGRGGVSGGAATATGRGFGAAGGAGGGAASGDKHMLLLAAQNPVGVAHLPGATVNDIVLGDSTVRLSQANEKSGAGFTKDLGTQITSGTEAPRALLPADVNGDGKKDLLVAYPSGVVRYFAYTGSASRYDERGVLIDVRGGIVDAVTGDIDHNGFDDLVVAVKSRCSPKDTCLDIYRNSGGFYTRENLPLDVGSSVSHLALVDINLDQILDLVTSDNNGDVKIFYGQNGAVAFAPEGQVVAHYPNGGTAGGLSSGAPDFIVNNHFSEVSSSDAFPDFMIKANGAATYYVSQIGSSVGGAVSYAPVALLSGASSTGSAASSAKPPQASDLVAGALDKTFDSKKLPSLASGLLKGKLAADKNGNGVPDSVDMFSLPKFDITKPGAFADGLANTVKSTISNFRCSGGGCLPLPINHAFLVPGLIGDKGVVTGYQPGLPVFGAFTSACEFWPVWPPCSYQAKDMMFRLYVSPTLTGKVAFAACFGGPYPSGTCYAFAPNISLIPSGLCKAISSKLGGLFRKAGASGSAGGQTVVYSPSRSSSGSGPPPTSGDITGVPNASSFLKPYVAEVSTSHNIRVPGFPKAVTDWFDHQLEEVLDKLGDLPDLYIMYPSLTSVFGSVLPKVPQGKLAGYSKFLAYLNSIPLISIEPKPLTIQVPVLTPSQVLRAKNDIDAWWQDLLGEFARVESIAQCSTAKSASSVFSFCQSLRFKRSKLLEKINANLRMLDQYAAYPKKILDYRNAEAKVVRQLINYLSGVSNFVGGYTARQTRRLNQWFEAINKIKNAINSWQVLIDVSVSYVANCDSCKNDRGSLLQFLLTTFVSIPSPPVVEFPKWPDIVLDFSRLEAGMRVTWPDPRFVPRQIQIPKIPRIRLPIQLPIVNVNLDKIFGDIDANIPQLPQLPSLPNLPDLPPLPVIKLPDLPPPPKIPSLEFSPAIKKSLDAFKTIFKILCLLKKGLIPVPESSLKTEIEALTARSLTPVLPFDISAKVQYPPIKYSAPDEMIVMGRFRFPLQTDLLYNFAKFFADKANAFNANLVNRVNAAGTNAVNYVQKEVTGPSSFVDDGADGGVDGAIGATARVAATNNYHAQLARRLASYADALERGGSGDGMLASAVRDAAGDAKRQYAQAGVSDTGGAKLVAQVGSGSGGSSGSVGSGAPSSGAISSSGATAVDDFAGLLGQATAAATADEPAYGIYVEDPVTHNASSLIDYAGEMERGVVTAQRDVDGDSDEDFFYSLGGDVYFKENLTSNKQDAFAAHVSDSPDVVAIDSVVPRIPAPVAASADYSAVTAITVNWRRPYSSSNLAGYDLIVRDANGSRTTRYLLPHAAGKLPYNDAIPVSPLSDGDAYTVPVSGITGLAYFTIVPIDMSGQLGTGSAIGVISPQQCLNSDSGAPVIAAGDDIRRVAIMKTLTIDASGSFDPQMPITRFRLDRDITIDSDKNGNPADDADHDTAAQSNSQPIFTVGPFDHEGSTTMRLFAENAAGSISTRDITADVYIPDISLGGIDTNSGVVYGTTTPAEPLEPFSLVRQRGGTTSIIGDYLTKNDGSFSVNGLHLEGTSVVKNSVGDVVAEYSEDTGTFQKIKSGYTVSVVPAQPPYPTLIQLRDAQGNVLISIFPVSDANIDTVIDDPSVSYTSDTVFDFKGVHIKPVAAGGTSSGGVIFSKIAANDPQFYGGTSISDGTTKKRLAVIDSAGRIYFFDAGLSLRYKAGLPDDMPYVLEIVRSSSGFGGAQAIAEVFIASDYGKKLTLVDAGEFGTKIASPTVAAVQQAGQFADVSAGSPYFDAIMQLKQRGIVEGTHVGGTDVFKPNDLIQRSEFTKIILKTLCIEPRPAAYQPPSFFSDVTYRQPLDWFYGWVKESYLRGFITGYLGEKNANGLAPFKPLATITRAESTKITVAALDMLHVIGLPADIGAARGAAWYEPYLKLAVNLTPYLKQASLGTSSFLLTPDEAHDPNHLLSRGEFALMASRVLKTYDCRASAAGGSGVGGANGGASTQTPPNIPTPPVVTPGGSGAKSSSLPPRVYGFLPICNRCPCISSLDNTGDILPGDTVFAIISNADHSVIYRKSNAIVLPASLATTAAPP